MRKLTRREKRLLGLVVLVGALVTWDKVRRRWSPDITVETEHYIIYSTATPQQTAEIGVAAEILYRGYTKLIGEFRDLDLDHPKLKVKLFKDRA